MNVTRTVVLAILLVAQQPTPSQLIDQISTLLKQLQAQVTPPTAPVIKTGAELTAALKAGTPTIALGTTPITGNFVITKPVVITGAGMDPSGINSTVTPLDPLVPAITCDTGADDVIVQDLVVRNGDPSRDTIVCGDFQKTTLAAMPHRVRFQRVSVIAGPNGGHRGIMLNGTDMTVTNSQILGFWEIMRDSQAICIIQGQDFTITDNVLEGAGENLLVGGADPSIVGNVPTNVLIARNTIRKPQAWRTIPKVTIKNIVELKNVRKAVIEDNVLDGNWASQFGQGGTALVYTVRNQDGKCPQCVVDDVTTQRNEIKNTPDGYAVNILGSDNNFPSQQTLTMKFQHNLWRDSYSGFLIGSGVANGLVVDHNTFGGIKGVFLIFEVDPRPVPAKTPLTWTNNVHSKGQYGVNTGSLPLTAYISTMTFTGNVIEGNPYATPGAPSDNAWVAALAPLLNPTTLKLLNGTAGY